MTYEEYMKWVKDSKIDLSKLDVRINNPLLPQFEVGCYDNHDGTWTYYRADERTIYKEVGTENDVFDKLKDSTISMLVKYEYAERCKIQSNLIKVLRDRNLTNVDFYKLTDTIKSKVRYNMGYGFGFAKIENGEEVFTSPFFNEVDSFIDYILNNSI